MTKRLMVTGCGGFVAGSVVWHAGTDWEVHACSRGEALLQRDGLLWHSFDPSDTERLRAVFREVRPDAVIHAAAIADIDYCEANKEVAKQVNVGVTDELASLCRQGRARMVYLSTDTVFDGEKGGYREGEPPSPLNYYAETKVEAENIVAAETDNCVVARLSLVMGLPLLGAGNSFLSRMLPKFEEGQEVGVPAEEIRSPVDVITLARALLEISSLEYRGLLNVAGPEITHRYDLGLRMAAHYGLSADHLVPGLSAESGLHRPLDCTLNCERAYRMLEIPIHGVSYRLPPQA